MKKFILLLICLVSIGLADQKVSVDVIGLGTAGPYRLGNNLILDGSEIVIRDSLVLVHDDDYTIDYAAGLITFMEPLGVSDTAIVTFSILPLNLKQSYSLIKPVEYTAGSRNEETDEYIPATKYKNSDIKLVGSKGIAINLGDGVDPVLSQSMDIDISGYLADDIEIQGSITDRNTGGSGTGSTRSLDELDRIYLNVRARNFESEFGDIVIDGIDNSILDFSRKLTGLKVQGTGKHLGASSSLAFSPGEQIEFFFYGRDGFQGPYRLENNSLSLATPQGSLFLPGTEEVYLDGIRLERGSEYDYEIDYYNGNITFTPRKIISASSRITVKIQYSPDNYRRTFYNVNSTYDGTFNLSVQYIGDKDDKSRPRQFEIGAEERAILEAAGGLQENASKSGATYVGSGNGDYVAEADSNGTTYYVYSADGDYSVIFSRSLTGIGDYNYAGSGIYVWQGEGNGAYLPLIYYSLPESKDFGSVIFNYEQAYFLNFELAGSACDRNTFSSIDKTQNGIGISGETGVTFSNLDVFNDTWEFTPVRVNAHSFDAELVTPGIYNPPEFFRKYNIPQSSVISNEDVIELSSQGRSVRGSVIETGFGYFDNNLYQANRKFGKTLIKIRNQISFASDIEITESENLLTDVSSDWNKYKFVVESEFGFLSPAVEYLNEYNDGLNTSVSGFKADQYRLGLDMRLSHSLSTGSSLKIRNQQASNGFETQHLSWVDEYEQYEIEQTLSYATPELSGNLRLARFYQDRVYPSMITLTRNLGDLKITLNKPSMNLTYYENINGTGRLAREREYIYVGDGEGDYRLDGQDYIPEPGGGYIEVIRQLDNQFESGYEITGGLRSRTSGKAISSRPALANITLENEYSHTTNLNPESRLKPEYLIPLNGFDENKMIYQRHQLSNRTSYRLNKQGDFIRHSLSYSRSRGSDFQFEQLDDETLSNSIDLKLLSRQLFAYYFLVEYATDRRILYSGVTDLQRTRLNFTPQFGPADYFRLELPLEYGKENESSRDLDIRSLSAGLKSVVNFRGSGRVEAEIGYTRVNLSDKSQIISYIAAGGNKPGDNFKARFTARFKINSYSRFEISFNYKELGDGYTNNNLRLEAKAQF